MHNYADKLQSRYALMLLLKCASHLESMQSTNTACYAMICTGLAWSKRNI